MDCPKCRKPMRKSRIGDVEIDECATCKGAWFDKDELRRAKDQTRADLNWMDFEIWEHKDRFRLQVHPLRCPMCDVDMVAIGYDDTRVEVDYCPRCGGTWLDAGEFEKIIDALNTEANTKSFSDYVKASLEEAREIVTGPESFVSEWKDFTTILRLLQYRLLADHPWLLGEIEKLPK